MLHLSNQAEAGYEPYTALCRGENASEADLWKCYKALKVSIPLYRGLYADQLERWYRVFDRSQVWKPVDDGVEWSGPRDKVNAPHNKLSVHIKRTLRQSPDIADLRLLERQSQAIHRQWHGKAGLNSMQG